jgi:uncharacterized protein
MKREIKVALLLLAAVSLGGCASKASRFYTLSPLGAQQPAATQQSRPVVVSVDTVDIPDYLNRPQIVTREGGNELKVAEFHRWGGSLAENLSSVLAEDLSRQLGSDHVYANLAPAYEKPEYLVALQVNRLDAVPGSHVLLKAQWKVTSTASKKSVSQTSQVTEQISGSGYDAMVAAMDRAVAQVSRQIAKEIQSVPAAAPTAVPRAEGVSP